MERLSTRNALKQDDQARLQEHVSRFVAACQQSATADLRQFLPPPEDALRWPILSELLRIDLELRWQRQQPIFLEQYLTTLPELGAAADLPVELLYAEYRARCLHGDRPPLDVYQERFPGQFTALQRMVRAHEAQLILTADATPAESGSSRPEGPAPALQMTAVQSGGSAPSRPGGPLTQARPPEPKRPALDLPRDSVVLQASGGYRLLERIGRGGFGEVWKAEAPGGVAVAVKVISRPVEHRESQRELQALELIKGLRHPFLLQTQAYWIHEDHIYIVMDLADGSLRDRDSSCRKAGQPGLPLDELIRYFRESAEALDYLHSHGVLHRDIKPENMLLLQGHVKVGDFGLARWQEEQMAAVSATGCGTPKYMAPEVWRGKASQHTDQYALAATYAELRLGRPLFPATDLATMMRLHLESKPDLAPLAAGEQDALLRALAKAPPQRYPNCREFMKAVEATLGPELAAAGPGAGVTPSSVSTSLLTQNKSVVVRAWRLSKSGMIGLLLVAALLAVGGVIMGYVHIGPGKPTAPETPLVQLPPGYAPAADSDSEVIQGQRWPRRIDYILPDGTRVPFVLVPKRPGTGDPDTFYIMVDKVSVGLFKRFDAENPNAVKHLEWKKGGVKLNPTDSEGTYLGIADDRLPALNVHVDDANRFAGWLKGKLPRLEQWDKAAGRFEDNPRKGPFEGDWKPEERDAVAVNREVEGPMPVGAATKDRSPFGCRDMSGNGYEWTRNLTNAGQFVPLSNPSGLSSVQLRGRRYDSQRPLLFSDIGADIYASQPYREPDPYIGFRVVMEP